MPRNRHVIWPAGIDESFDDTDRDTAAFVRLALTGAVFSANDATASDSDDGRDTIHKQQFYRKG